MAERTIRDPIHGDITLTDREIQVLDTPQVQRLRGVRQLGAAHYVYPGAQHSRFEHGLGTAWMAKRMVKALARYAGFGIPPEHREAVSLAALVHDVTHIPFGHTFEDERRLLERHDTNRTRYERLLVDSTLGRVLRRDEPGHLALRLLEPGGELPAELRYLRQIVSGTICADLLDYLKRDNYYCGLNYEFDDRLFHYFQVAGGRLALGMSKRGLFRHDALSEVTNLLRIRYVLSERVYYHHAKIAAGVMISRAVQTALEAGLAEADLCRLTDDGLLDHLERMDAGPALADLVDNYRARRLYKRCFMLSREIGQEHVERLVAAHHFNRDGARDEAEAAIAAAAGARPHQVAVYCAPEGMALKEADVPVVLPGERTGLLSSMNRAEIQVLKDQHRALWRLYVFIAPDAVDRADAAARVAEEVFGLPNELPRYRAGRV
jgi:hypothetical protein